MNNEFQQIMNNTKYHDKVFLFLQNVFNLRPEDKFFHLIKTMSGKYSSDREIYQAIQSNLNDRFYYGLTHAIPALLKQKRVLTEQTIRLLRLSGLDQEVNGYMEIGTVGRYASRLNKTIKLNNVVFYNDIKPTYGPIDMLDREAFFKFGNYEQLSNNEPIPNKYRNSLEVITCYVGLHHIELEKLHSFIKSISDSLKPGGVFILRDHDCSSEDMKTFASLIHTIFNSGTSVSLDNNFQEIRHFRSCAEWIEILRSHNLEYKGLSIRQDNDPSDNLLMSFEKRSV